MHIHSSLGFSWPFELGSAIGIGFGGVDETPPGQQKATLHGSARVKRRVSVGAAMGLPLLIWRDLGSKPCKHLSNDPALAAVVRENHFGTGRGFQTAFKGPKF